MIIIIAGVLGLIGIVNGVCALYYAMKDRHFLALMFTLNFATLVALVTT